MRPGGCPRRRDADAASQGSDFFTIYVRPTAAPLAPVDGARPSHDDERLPDEIRYVKFSGISWTHDSEGFFYQVRVARVPRRACADGSLSYAITQRFAARESHGEASGDTAGTETESDKNAMLYYHRIGTDSVSPRARVSCAWY